MTTNTKLKVRRSIRELEDDYKNGVKKPLEDLMRAWYGIKALPYDNSKSFFVLGGYHGEPFRGAGWGNSSYWGGYCNHGNVLFPTWHRAYLVKLEEALQSIDGCKDVTQPYWDETSEDSQAHGVPWALTQEFFELSEERTWPGTNNGSAIPNPLRSFVLPRAINDHISGIDANNAANYSKPDGYETVRFPKSSLVGTPVDSAATAAHNAQWSDYTKCVRYLNNNVIDWLTSTIVVDGAVIPTHVVDKYKKCLNAPNYTVFSNTSSRDQWNDNQPADQQVQCLESPHGAIHLALGGIQVPTQNVDMIAGANGDMGENDTAGLDPIFFFHHSYVDRMFWLWQKNHSCKDGTSCTKKPEVIPEYPGTNSVDSHGPTPGVVPNSWLTMKSPLDPFKKADGTAYTSEDCSTSKAS
jgi:tyrosinase